tara:strand:- start:194 stop:655 length:462 start_codon:yes stop_codon:yes gene_type:complete
LNEDDINSLNKKITIHFPLDELAVYMNGSELDNKAMPVLIKTLSSLGLQLNKVPNKIVYRSRLAMPGHSPDETLSLLSIKKNNPDVDFRKLERLYNDDLLLKFIWKEHFKAEDVKWRELLLLCNSLVERSATDFDVFLKFSLINEETLELVTN